ncbi:MAG: hypothetical protein H6619_05825 [Deltaproteobacteria bacterium]|nr:hypothetical protein [Deltaproteobacteria bacterium]
MEIFRSSALIFALVLASCSSLTAEQKAKPILSFEECVAAGNQVLRSMPPKCVTKDGLIFIQEKPNTCIDKCGDGECQEIVCQAIDCPCAETAESCPEDCKS